MKTGYSIKTWKMRLFCPEKQMIETTEALYREAVAFYYELLKKEKNSGTKICRPSRDIWKSLPFPEETEENQSTSRQAESSPFIFGDLP